jgi:hypothetical protein
METLEYSTVDKSDWGVGPWHGECDKRQWTDPATGYPCLIVRADLSGALCGYVGVADSHSLFGVGYNDIDVQCHGGLTFADVCQPHRDETSGICHLPAPGEPDNVWWFGFDCSHAWDLSPALSGVLRGINHAFRDRASTYRDMAYVSAQVTALAAQLASLDKASR